MADDASFLESFESDANVATIKILGHTGRSIIAPLETFAANRDRAGFTKQIDVNILLRDKDAESPRRRNQIVSSVDSARALSQKYPWLRVEIRHYSAQQTLRGAVVTRCDGSRIALFSAYEWPPRTHAGQVRVEPIRTTAVRWSKRLEPRQSANHDQTRLMAILENWFDYYWGPGLIHTIAFDFDDTIIDTYEDKVNAWVLGVERVLGKMEGGADCLRCDFRKMFESGTAKQRYELLKRIIDRVPKASNVIKEILTEAAPSKVGNYLDEQRSVLRRDALFPPEMTQAELRDHVSGKIFRGAREALHEIRIRGYALAVGSLTGEDRIETALELAEIPYFGVIVGKSESRDRELRDLIENDKVYLIRKIANLSGVPASRVLYIGDHVEDENAARLIGAPFIQAQLLSCVVPSCNPKTLRFDEYAKLANVVELAEGRARASQKIPHSGRHY